MNFKLIIDINIQGDSAKFTVIRDLPANVGRLYDNGDKETHEAIVQAEHSTLIEVLALQCFQYSGPGVVDYISAFHETLNELTQTFNEHLNKVYESGEN